MHGSARSQPHRELAQPVLHDAIDMQIRRLIDGVIDWLPGVEGVGDEIERHRQRVIANVSVRHRHRPQHPISDSIDDQPCRGRLNHVPNPCQTPKQD